MVALLLNKERLIAFDAASEDQFFFKNGSKPRRALQELALIDGFFFI